MFALLFLIGHALVYSSGAAAVRYARYARYARCGRALDLTTHRDRYPRAAPLACEEERISPPGPGGSPASR